MSFEDSQEEIAVPAAAGPGGRSEYNLDDDDDDVNLYGVAAEEVGAAIGAGGKVVSRFEYFVVGS